MNPTEPKMVLMVPKAGHDLIAAERLRQITQEGFDYDHDMNHRAATLSTAGKCYIDHADFQLRNPGVKMAADPPAGWPWGPRWWKPSEDPVRNLVKGGALIAAAIDRARADPS